MNCDTPEKPAEPIDFRTAYCQWVGCPVDQFEKRVLKQTLFLHARILRALARPFRPHSFYAEYLAVKQAGDKQLLEDIELDVDFYQHKHVVGTLMRESFNCRLSGRQLVRLARNAFRAAGGTQPIAQRRREPSPAGQHPEPA